MLRPVRVALVHDWLTGMRGGERVLDVLATLYPDAELYTLIHVPGSTSPAIERLPIHASPLSALPGAARHYRKLLPLFPWAIERFRLEGFDLVLSTHHAVAKGVRIAAGTKHLCYCFTPMRYAWTFYDEYFGSNPVKKILLKPTLAALRSWDRAASARVDRFVAISRHVQDRIRSAYGREADVVYPPVNTEFYTPAPAETARPPFDLIVSALVPYKRLDLAIAAYNQLGFPLKIVGSGTERDKLQAGAGKNIEFLGWQPDGVIRDLYRGCRLLVFPGEEDFGIVPVEAQACGKPVVAFNRGGVTESIIANQTGTFFDEPTTASMIAAVEEAAATSWDAIAIRRNAERFSVQVFLDGLDASIQQCLKG